MTDANGIGCSAPTPSASCRDANGVRTPVVVYIANERGKPIRVAITTDGVIEYHPLTLVQATDLIESLTRAVRERLPGGW